jgi:Spy/CpxP family protein refolding chaperone
MTRAPRILAVTVASALAVSAIALPAGAAPDGPRGRGPASLERYQQHLGLTDQQMTAIRDVRGRHADQRRETAKALDRAQAELRDLALTSGDAAAVKAKSAEVAGLMTRAVEQRTAELQEIAPILTPEQRGKLAKMGGEGFHHRRGPAGGEKR